MAKKKSALWKDFAIIAGGLALLAALPVVLGLTTRPPDEGAPLPPGDQGDEDEF